MKVQYKICNTYMIFPAAAGQPCHEAPPHMAIRCWICEGFELRNSQGRPLHLMNIGGPICRHTFKMYTSMKTLFDTLIAILLIYNSLVKVSVNHIGSAFMYSLSLYIYIHQTPVSV